MTRALDWRPSLAVRTSFERMLLAVAGQYGFDRDEMYVTVGPDDARVGTDVRDRPPDGLDRCCDAARKRGHPIIGPRGAGRGLPCCESRRRELVRRGRRVRVPPSPGRPCDVQAGERLEARKEDVVRQVECAHAPDVGDGRDAYEDVRPPRRPPRQHLGQDHHRDRDGRDDRGDEQEQRRDRDLAGPAVHDLAQEPGAHEREHVGEEHAQADEHPHPREAIPCLQIDRAHDELPPNLCRYPRPRARRSGSFVLTLLVSTNDVSIVKSTGGRAIIQARRGRDTRETLNRDRVLRAAMELADARGIDSLTMRALGRRLGVEAASLYNHVTGKDDLLDGITDLVVGEIDVPTRAADWRHAMRRRATSALDVFSRHPWASGLIDSRGQMGPARLAYVDGVLGVLLGAGFSAEAAANAFMALDSYIYGFERQRTELNLGEGGADTTAAARSAQMAASPEAYPALERVAGEFATRPYDVATSFEFGLDLILDGLERLLTSGRSADSRAVQ